MSCSLGARPAGPGGCGGQDATAEALAKHGARARRWRLPWPRSRPSHTIPIRFHPTRSKEGAWKLVDFENWAWAGQPADVSYALRYAAPEVRSRVLAFGRRPADQAAGDVCVLPAQPGCPVTTCCEPSIPDLAAPACRHHLSQLPAADMCGEATIAADPSMDMFSLGVLAWEVMTGKRFFGGGWAGK